MRARARSGIGRNRSYLDFPYIFMETRRTGRTMVAIIFLYDFAVLSSRQKSDKIILIRVYIRVYVLPWFRELLSVPWMSYYR